VSAWQHTSHTASE